MDLIILGAGQYGQVVKETAEVLGYVVSFLDDRYPNATVVDSILVKGKLVDWHKFSGQYFVAIGDLKVRMQWIERLLSHGKKLATLIHPRSYVSPSVEMGAGSIVEPMAVINSGVVVGKGVYVCAGAVVNHNAVIGDGCQIDANTTVPSGETAPAWTKIGEGMVWKNPLIRSDHYDFDATM